MILKMHQKIIDNVLCYVLGVFGYGIAWTNLVINENVLKFFIAMLSALCAGFVGYLGKRAAIWLLLKIKALINTNSKP